MILKAKERGNGKQLGLYLLRDKNEHVEVHELRGFMADDLTAALQEIDAISKGTRAVNYLFSVTLNPPARERVSVESYEAAVEAIEKKLGLEGQPRAVVFHEKDGRRHAHAVWSRIDAARMRAINMAHYKIKLRDVSRKLFIEHGWQMPRGLVNSKERDPRNFTQAQWEQAKRAGKDARALKELFQDCWAISDSPKAFRQALASRGYILAKGDRRGLVAVDFKGDVYSIARWVGQKTKDVRKRLGDGKDLPSVAEAHAAITEQMTGMLREHVAKVEATHRKKAADAERRKEQIIERQRKERTELRDRLDARWTKETAERAKRLSTGMRGLWDRLTGKQSRQVRDNEREALQALQRDKRAMDRLIVRQIVERQSLHAVEKQLRQAQTKEIAELHRDIAGYIKLAENERAPLREEFRESSRKRGGRGKGRKKDDPERSM